MDRLRRWWSSLRSNFWFLPTLIVLFSIALAVFLTGVDLFKNGDWMARWPRVFGAGAEGARGMLSTIAGSMMTVVGLTFSMTLVTLSLASSQYASRVLRNFMGDRVTQVVLGIFAGIFTYCLIVLRTIRGGDDAFVPGLAVTVAVVMAVGGIGMLILFIHHIASSIQASSIIASIANETIRAVERIFPEQLGQSAAESEVESASSFPSARTWQPVPAVANGYVDSVDNDALLNLAREHRTVVRMDCGVGHFAVRGTTLASIALNEPPTKEEVAALRSTFSLSRHRTPEQDAAYGIRQIVDIALRALSPGINDPTTAVMCVNYLTAILARVAERRIPGTHRYEDGELRVIAVAPTFGGMVALAFDQIRDAASGSLALLLPMLVGLQTLAAMTGNESRRQALREQAQLLGEAANRTLKSPHERERFEACLVETRVALARPYSRSAEHAS